MTFANQIKQQQAEQLLKLIAYFGTQTMTAKKLGVSKQTVNNWVNRGRISATSAIEAEIVTLGYFTKQKLRPDVVAWME